MFKFLVVVAFVACVAANAIDVVKQEADVRADGFESELVLTDDSKQVAKGDVHGNINGEFSWISPEGEHIIIKYVADENGYQPVGDAIPTPPPVPEDIAKAVAYLKSLGPRDEKTKY